MSGRRTSPAPAPVRVRGPRLSGVDAARGIALLGMMATHILPLSQALPGGGAGPTWTALLFSGRASALFAVLAGVGLALLTGGARPYPPEHLRRSRRGIAVRALLVAAIGLAAGSLDAGVAVILVHYGVLFLLALPFLGLPVRRLAWWAGGWLLLSPVALFLLLPLARAWVDPSDVGGSPAFTDLANPATVLADLFVTGYYPVVAWLGFLLVGLAVGRSNLSRPPVALALLAGGTAVAAAARWASAELVALPGADAALRAATGLRAGPLEAALATGRGLDGAQGSWWWFALASPHTGSPLDLIHTAGTALAVLGGCLLVAAALEATLGQLGEALLWPLAGAGAATLTLYVGHLVALDLLSGLTAELPRLAVYLGFVVAALLAGIVLKWSGVRGPLEAAVHAASRAAAGGSIRERT
ncbi:transporter [Zafaria cholistanensis]|uniref:Transporter n=1 Tax=Zafaria cholistanensis TaxID=1682741 RepID=A0A5A7NNL6_9MICC|nr:heparan-alpha-glucosaminide N-acetyltransferase domain-containing protein [Zafaria cholistanensis]GER22514.1 transporter [Zafaria cholistanensis]